MAAEELKINDLNVDIAYSPIVIKALFEDTVLVPERTYTTDVVERAGKVYFHVESKDTVVAGAPGRAFSDVDVADTLKELPYNQNFQISKKIYGVQVASVKFDLVASQVDLVGKSLKSAVQKVGLVIMAKDSTDYNDTTAITKDNVTSYIIGARKKLRDAGARMDYIIASTSVYAAILGDKEKFSPTVNDEQLKMGIVGRYLGADVYEANGLTDTAVTLNGDTTYEYDLTKIDFIAGQTDGFVVGRQLDMLRVKDSELFNGVKVQGELNCGFMVTNSSKIVTKFNGSLAVPQ